MKKKKYQKPLMKQKWNKQTKFYHNLTSKHFILTIASKGDYVAGHDMTTHPSLKRNGKIKRKYILSKTNPNPNDKRQSYVDRKLRIGLKIHFTDTGKTRLRLKRGWKLSKKDKKLIKKLDRGIL